MPPISKFWKFELRPEAAEAQSSLNTLFSEIVTFCSSYTNPASDPNIPDMHVIYRDTQDPNIFLMVTGYPSQELNTEADKNYSAKFMFRMFEFVQHVWLRQLDFDVTELGLSDHIVVSCGGEMKGVGGWDVWKRTQQGKQKGVVQGAREGEAEDEDLLWIQVEGWDGTGDIQKSTSGEERLYLEKIVGR